jgi:hypothetical protein
LGLHFFIPGLKRNTLKVQRHCLVCRDLHGLIIVVGFELGIVELDVLNQGDRRRLVVLRSRARPLRAAALAEGAVLP